MIAYIPHGSNGWCGYDPGSIEGDFAAYGTDTTAPNTIMFFDSGVIYGTRFHKGIKAEDVVELCDRLRLTLAEDKTTKKFLCSTIRKEGREDSRRGWHNRVKILTCQVLSRRPQQPYRLMLGGANR